MFVQVEPAVSKNDLKKTFYKLVWPVRLVTLSLPSKSRSRAAVARRAHNPKVGSSILPFATGRSPALRDFFVMCTVYVLYSVSYSKIYIGYTSNLQARLLSHNELGKKGWTIRYRPWEIIYTEEHRTKQEALSKEKN